MNGRRRERFNKDEKEHALLLAAVLGVFAAPQVRAVIINYNVEGLMFAGGSFQGMFSLDTEADPFLVTPELARWSNPAMLDVTLGTGETIFFPRAEWVQVSNGVRTLELGGFTGEGPADVEFFLRFSVVTYPVGYTTLDPYGGMPRITGGLGDRRGGEFSFTNIIGSSVSITEKPPEGVPDGGSTALMLAMALGGMVAGIGLRR